MGKREEQERREEHGWEKQSEIEEERQDMLALKDFWVALKGMEEKG